MNGLYEADQTQASKKELADNQRHESPGSYPPLSSRRPRARMARWVDEKKGNLGHQSQVAELYGDYLSELAANPKSVLLPFYEMYDPSVPPKELPSAVPQLRSSPELHDPINSEPDRESLYQRRRGTPASHHHRSSANPCRSDLPLVGVTQNGTSSSSLRHSKPHESLRSVPNGKNEMLNSNAYTLQADATAPYQPRVSPMSHDVSPEDPAPTTNYPLTNVAFPSSPKAALASLRSDMESPISPIVEDVHPPLAIAFSAAPSHHGSVPGSSEQQEENAGGRTSISSSPLQSMPKEPNNTLFPFDTLDWDIQSLLSFYNSMESSAAVASQTENSVLQFSPPIVQNRYQSEQLDVPSVPTPPRHLGMYPSDLEDFIPSNGSEKVSKAEKSLSMTQSVMTPVYTPRSENPEFSPTAFSLTSPPQNSRTQPDSQSLINVQSPFDPTEPSTAFHIPTFSRSLNPQTGIVTEPVMEMDDLDNSDMSTQNMEQPDAGQSLCFPELQPWSPLDHFIAKNAFDLHSTGPQWHSNDHCPQAAPQHHSPDSGISQALFVKWRPYCFDHNSFLVSFLAPKQKQVEGLQNLICIINYEWKQRMESQPGLWPLYSTLSPSYLFDRAIRTLKNFICGSPPEGFEDVFAIMHLAFAAAFSLTWKQDDYLFSALRDDALQWQHALPRDEDKTRFSDAMNCWRLHELEPPPLFTSASNTKLQSMTPQDSHYCGDQQTLWDGQKKGEVFKVCIAFVDSKSIKS